MFNFDIYLKDGTSESVSAYTVEDFEYPPIKNHIISNRHKMYNSLILTFDIETSQYNIDDVPHSFMYHWQMGIGDLVVFGRTWADWLLLLRNIIHHYRIQTEKFVVYVHNLSYEYQFIRDFLNVEKIFAMKPHKILTFTTDAFEFRCSYLLSNMSLDKWTNTLPIKYLKRKDTFDYDIVRLPSTPLSDMELAYCYVDVRALFEAVMYTLTSNDDDLITIPLTSTGYVRRHARTYVLGNPKNWDDFTKCKLTTETYQMSKDAFRGGNTSANRYYVNQIIEGVGSYDKKSSYPYQLYSKRYPQGQFMLVKSPSLDDIDDNYAWLLSVRFDNLSLHTGVPIPYLSYHKCLCDDKCVVCNGRILYARQLETVCTEIDLQIILSQYDYDIISFGRCYRVKKRKLPDEFIESMLYWFDLKCDLQCDEDSPDYYYYTKSKNSLNSYYGMFVSDIVHNDILDMSRVKILGHDKLIKSWQVNAVDVDADISRYYGGRRNFLHYSKGIWVTAYARAELDELCRVTGDITLYIDTDSDKYILGLDDERITREVDCINMRIISDSYTKRNKYGEDVTLGVWEREKDVKRFKTLGAKKYYCEYDNHNKITVSGLNKKQSLLVIDNIDKFVEGCIVPPKLSGRTSAYYNDVGIHYVTIDGQRFISASNVALKHSDYTLSISDTLKDFLSLRR